MATRKTPTAKAMQNSHPELTKSQKMILIIIVVIIALLYAFKGLFVAATVNGTPIARLEVVKQLEKTAGKQTLEGLVTRQLLLQEARKRNITITEQEVDKEIKKIQASVKQQGGNFEELLTAQGMTKEDLKNQVKVQKIVEKMFADKIKVTEAEIDKFIADNQASMPQTTNEAALRSQVKQQLAQQKLSQYVQQLIGQLKKESKIKYFTNY